jgi:hypothetical protein
MYISIILLVFLGCDIIQHRAVVLLDIHCNILIRIFVLGTHHLTKKKKNDESPPLCEQRQTMKNSEVIV